METQQWTSFVKMQSQEWSESVTMEPKGTATNAKAAATAAGGGGLGGLIPTLPLGGQPSAAPAGGQSQVIDESFSLSRNR